MNRSFMTYTPSVSLFFMPFLCIYDTSDEPELLDVAVALLTVVKDNDQVQFTSSLKKSLLSSKVRLWAASPDLLMPSW
ncbi:hypothetical protein QQF64_036373 [Cirrhinus molitorella]|uniref:Uncharacterized protein n=1 Tax=Cirrhinus molitorella TaxID=172907 RepID=A0ABR3NIE6_9TELE